MKQIKSVKEPYNKLIRHQNYQPKYAKYGHLLAAIITGIKCCIKKILLKLH